MCDDPATSKLHIYTFIIITEKQRDLPMTDSIPKCLQQLGLGPARSGARNSTKLSSRTRPSVLGPTPSAFQTRSQEAEWEAVTGFEPDSPTWDDTGVPNSGLTICATWPTPIYLTYKWSLFWVRYYFMNSTNINLFHIHFNSIKSNYHLHFLCDKTKKVNKCLKSYAN